MELSHADRFARALPIAQQVFKKKGYWRINARATYAEFDEGSQNEISTVRIAEHGDDIVRLVDSLKLGKVKAPDIVRVLARDGKLGGLGNAVAEIGRLAKTVFMLEFHNFEGYRRKITAQLNRGESRHSPVKSVLHGEKGEIRKHYKRGMELQLGAVGFVVNTIIVWNTEHVGEILGLFLDPTAAPSGLGRSRRWVWMCSRRTWLEFRRCVGRT